MIYPINPMGKPRMTRRDSSALKINRIKGMRPVVARYWAFKEEVRYHKIDLPESGASITFFIEMPQSWSKKKKKEMNMTPHRQTPDLDNLVKALIDSIFDEDKHIWQLNGLEKRWAYRGAIIVDRRG